MPRHATVVRSHAPAGQRHRPTMTRFGQVLRRQRLDLGWTQQQLGQKIGSSKAVVSLIELGHLPLNKSDHIIDKLAKVLGMNRQLLERLRPPGRYSLVRKTPLTRWLTNRRLELRLTQRDLARKTGKSQTTVRLVEQGQMKPSRALVKNLELALGCKIPLKLLP